MFVCWLHFHSRAAFVLVCFSFYREQTHTHTHTAETQIWRCSWKLRHFNRKLSISQLSPASVTCWVHVFHRPWLLNWRLADFSRVWWEAAGGVLLPAGPSFEQSAPYWTHRNWEIDTYLQLFCSEIEVLSHNTAAKWLILGILAKLLMLQKIKCSFVSRLEVISVSEFVKNIP